MRPAYDEANIFAKILRGEVPCEKIYEDADTLVIMDVMPRADGHVLVIPKAASRNLLDAAPETLAPLAATVQKMARAVMAAFRADGVTVHQFNEAPAGQSVFHLHVHVIPRHDGVDLKAHSGDMEAPETLKANADRIRTALR